jgi:hypothetical protein
LKKLKREDSLRIELAQSQRTISELEKKLQAQPEVKEPVPEKTKKVEKADLLDKSWLVSL